MICLLNFVERCPSDINILCPCKSESGGKMIQSHDYAEDFEFVTQINGNTVILRSSKEIIPAANIRKTLCESDSHIMNLVNGDTIENVECVSIWEQHNKWNVPVSGSNITSGMCQYLGAT